MPWSKFETSETSFWKFHQEQRLHINKVAFEIGKQKTYTIEETLVKPCLLKIVKLHLRECSKAKMRRISYSSNTIQRHISDMWEDVKDQVINEMEASPMFFLVDGSTDVTSCAQSLVFMRYSFRKQKELQLQQLQIFWRYRLNPFLFC